MSLNLKILTQSVFIILCVFSYTANAQSKHAALWRIGRHCLDFNDGTVKFYPLNFNIKNNNLDWYVDSEGKISVIVRNEEYKMSIFNKEENRFEEIQIEYKLEPGFFVPMPDNRNKVFYIEQNRYFIIDLLQKSITLKGTDINIYHNEHIAVHHTDCDKVWIINVDKSKITTYLLTSLGIKKVNETSLKESDYSYFSTNYNWKINLSKDCEHYTMINFDDNKTEVYYGDFDRETGKLIRKSRYDFGQKYKHIINSIIAPDNSRIYYLYANTQQNYNIIEVPIINGIPDYNKQKKVFTEKQTFAKAYKTLFYGIDGKIYILDYIKNKICTIECKNNTTIYNDNEYFTPKNENFVRNNVFVSSWFMDNPCEEKDAKNPCATQKPSVEFDNSLVCYGQPLKLKLSGNAPFEVFYTLDNEEKTIKTSATEYIMPNVAGKYKITKIKDSVCEFYPTENNISEIANEIKELKIIAE